MKSLYDYLLEAVNWVSTSTEDEGIDDIDLYNNAYIPSKKRQPKEEPKEKFIDLPDYSEKEDKDVSIYILDSGRMIDYKKQVSDLVNKLKEKYTGKIDLYRTYVYWDRDRRKDYFKADKINSLKELHQEGAHPFFSEVFKHVLKNTIDSDYNIFITDDEVFWLEIGEKPIDVVKSALEKTNLIFYAIGDYDGWLGDRLDSSNLLEKGKCEYYKIK